MKRKRGWNVGDIPEVTADEDVDRDVEIAEEETRRGWGKRSARQRIEDLKDGRERDE